MEKVFVYGTLKSGHGNHDLLRGAALVAPCSGYLAPFKMLNVNGWFPAVRPTDDGEDFGEIHGEIYEVDDKILAKLDHLEGHPDFYERIKHTFGSHEAWIYVWPKHNLAMARDTFGKYPVISSGKWR